jgi:hypothetical protein
MRMTFSEHLRLLHGPNTASLAAPAHWGVALRTQGSSFATALAFCKTSPRRLLWASAASD